MTRDAHDAAEFAIHGSISRRRFLARAGQAALGVAALPILAACAPSGGDGATSTPRVVAGKVVEMTDDMRFVPEQLTVKVGETVTWRNAGAIVHTATDDPSKAQDPANAILPEGVEAWDSGDVAGGEEWSHTFETPGDYTYFCIPHELAGMVARLTVTDG